MLGFEGSSLHSCDVGKAAQTLMENSVLPSKEEKHFVHGECTDEDKSKSIEKIKKQLCYLSLKLLLLYWIAICVNFSKETLVT